MTSHRRKSRPARKKPKGGAKPDLLDAVIDANVNALDLKMDPTWKPAIRGNLQLILRLGALVTAFPLPDDAEPAPVFEP